MRLERLAGHVLHHQVAVVGLDHRVEDVDDVRVVQLAGKRRLGDEGLVQHALAVRVGMGVEQEHLDRHLAVGEGIPRQIDAAGGAAADLPQDRVLAQLLFRLELHAGRYFMTCSSSSDSWYGLPRKALTPSCAGLMMSTIRPSPITVAPPTPGTRESCGPMFLTTISWLPMSSSTCNAMRWMPLRRSSTEL